MAIIYEVNLKIAQTILQEYLSWLYEHINEMLAVEGFLSATLFEEIETEGEQGEARYIVQYTVESLEALNHYLQYLASQMRQEAIKRFEGNFSATRRILKRLSKEVIHV